MNVYEANGYHYLDEAEPRIPAVGPHLSGTVFDFQGGSRHVRFFCTRLTLAESLELSRICRPTWSALGLRGPLYLDRTVERALGLDFDNRIVQAERPRRLSWLAQPAQARKTDTV
ncbi:hypothetical protein GXW82_21170 [Streptacidiphilus sp. 4-A2]|nr:hypothetical protein [Streptacidiphilus sp. 4-A2]